LKQNDILLSIVGTVGKLSLVKEDNHATCSCKLAILRPQELNSNYISIFLESKYGQKQIERFTRGAVQQGLILEDMNQLLVPYLKSIFKLKIDESIELAYQKLSKSKSLYKEAENILLEELDLLGFEPTQENIAIKSFSESFLATGRLDSEYYQPKYDEIIEKIKSYRGGFDILSNRFTVINGKTPKKYIKNGIEVIKTKNIRIPTIDLNNIQDFINEKLIVTKENDLLFASMGTGSLGRISYIDKGSTNLNIDGTLKIFRVKDLKENIQIPIMIFLTSKFGQEIIYRYTIGSTGIISISSKNINNLIIPIINIDIANRITKYVLESINLKKESKNLLDLAKRAVEVAIEEGEDVALEMIGEEYE